MYTYHIKQILINCIHFYVESPPRRRELDNVMKKARKEGPDKSNYWNKKLLEVEEKDPNRQVFELI